MDSHRRRWLVAGIASAGLVGAAVWRLWPDEGLTNPCLGPLPGDLRDHPLLREAWSGLDPQRVWDGHVHLFASADAAHADDSPWPHWLAAAQARFIANAACTDPGADDFAAAYVAGLIELLTAMPAGYKAVLLAMDRNHDPSGKPRPELTHFSVANSLCMDAARRAPERLEWAASIHPYRHDAVEELARVTALGARAIKWIPAAQAIDPGDARCDDFFAALAASGLPLITHTGAERATPGDDGLGNPLRLRRALDHGVRVVAAHCASMGASRDLDAGGDGPLVSNFSLFERLMDEPRYQHLLFGDLAAIPQTARTGAALERIILRGATGEDWSGRLLHGSDYPLPGLMPLYSPRLLAEQGLIDTTAVEPLAAIRRHNPLLFDFVVKRHLRVAGRRLADAIFHTRDFYRGPQHSDRTWHVDFDGDGTMVLRRGRDIDAICDDLPGLVGALNKSEQDPETFRLPADAEPTAPPKLKLLGIRSRTARLEIINSEYLTQRMGSTGAEIYLAEAVFTLTECPRVTSVQFVFEEGDHARPGTYSRSNFTRNFRIAK